ncbi:uncharacterized protein LOC119687867 [Teleopsis dalmanni]|uniref:uncharacterized protein LOC119687867 n=1 Tax=Teleopsis dalmanni TaxID=139649 RepID=UPI0018CD6F53|nr:uncharacterized protein LOC119687867 [Teleopsis dalmanni]
MAEYMPYTTNYSFYRYFDNDLVEPMNTTFHYNHKVNKIEQKPKATKVPYENRVPTLADMMGGFPNIDVNTSPNMNNSQIFFDHNGNYITPHMMNAPTPPMTAQNYSPRLVTKEQNVKPCRIYNSASYTIVGNGCTDNKNKKKLPVVTDCSSNQTKKNHRKPIVSSRSRATTYRRRCFRKQQKSEPKTSTSGKSEQNSTFVTVSYPTLNLGGSICAGETLKHVHNFVHTAGNPWSEPSHAGSSSLSCPYCNRCYCLNNAISHNSLGSTCYMPASKPEWRW